MPELERLDPYAELPSEEATEEESRLRRAEDRLLAALREYTDAQFSALLSETEAIAAESGEVAA